ncbi:hypothetical protein BRC60_01295 [Halobacteriales archaeon QH_1_68_42]|nr:MAG: hypothetical protein BRC60_01295 [Halobacteriales archaeon QH_1_68_42]
MGAADEQIRVSETVKQEIERRHFLAGFGRWSDERADRAREVREKYKKKSKERMRRRSENA